jgi:hypothetical protein
LHGQKAPSIKQSENLNSYQPQEMSLQASKMAGRNGMKQEVAHPFCRYFAPSPVFSHNNINISDYRPVLAVVCNNFYNFVVRIVKSNKGQMVIWQRGKKRT